MSVDTVDYNILDAAKLAFISASKSTITFAQPWATVSNPELGASANLMSLSLSPWITGSKTGPNIATPARSTPAVTTPALTFSLVPEGLGTADDARPEDLSESELTEFWFEIGIKSVAVMTNDAASSGLQTLAIGLYLPSSEPEVVFSRPFLKGFLDGFVSGCKRVGCVYLSGETPQLKNKIQPGRLDIAGAVWAIALPDRPTVQSDAATGGPAVGDIIVGIESTGPHENGYTTIRKLAAQLPHGFRTAIGNGSEQLWRATGRGSALYTPVVQSMLKAGVVPSALENVTGHGWQKIMRSKAALRYVISSPLPLLPVFSFLEEHLKVSRTQLLTLFNCGTGFVAFVKSSADAAKAIEAASQHGYRAQVIGQVEQAQKQGVREVVVPDWKVSLSGSDFALSR